MGAKEKDEWIQSGEPFGEEVLILCVNLELRCLRSCSDVHQKWVRWEGIKGT